MKYNLLIITTLITQMCFGQEVLLQNDSVQVIIPKLDLNFKEINTSSSTLLSSTSYQISTTAGDDSIYVYQNDPSNAFILIGNDSSFLKSNLQVPFIFKGDNSNFQYRFSFDSLGTNNQYLILKWYGRQYHEHASHSGSNEYLCHETISEYESIEHGVTIISLISKKVLFQGFTEIRNKESQTKNPGRHKKDIKNEKITKVQFIQNNDYLNLFHHGYQEYNYWTLYEEGLQFGIYQIVDDQYVLIRKT